VKPVANVIYVQWQALEALIPRSRYVGRIQLSPSDASMLARPPAEPPPQAAVFATVGTTKFPFDRLIRAVDQLPNSEEAVIQTSASGVRPERALGVAFLPFDLLTAYMRRAQVVITHGGFGSVFLARANGKRPIVIPRRAEFGEHVDDHQIAFARSMAAEGLITLVEDLAQLPDVIADCPDSELPGAEDREDRLSAELLAYFNAVVRQRSRLAAVGHRDTAVPQDLIPR
jgi:UDP-N-acetylglucosamine transferase subunit ALG13